jgi:hypothetical protein
VGGELNFPAWDVAYVKNRLKEAPNYLKDKGGYIIFDEGDSWLINNEYRLFLELHTVYRGCMLKIFSEIEYIHANSPNPWPPRWKGTEKLYQDYDRSRNDLPMLSIGILDMFYPINLGLSLNGIMIQQALISLRDFGEWVAPDGTTWRFMYDNHVDGKKCMIFGNDGDGRIIIHAYEGAYGTDLSLSSNSTIETLNAFCTEAESRFNEPRVVGGNESSIVYTYDHPTSQMTIAEKLEAYLDWTGQDKIFRPTYIDWAIHKFNGTEPNGDPKVPQKTLLGWKRYLKLRTP